MIMELPPQVRKLATVKKLISSVFNHSKAVVSTGADWLTVNENVQSFSLRGTVPNELGKTFAVGQNNNGVTKENQQTIMINHIKTNNANLDMRLLRKILVIVLKNSSSVATMLVACI